MAAITEMPQVLDTIEKLRSAECDYDLIRRLHGVVLHADHPLLEAYHKWLKFNRKTRYRKPAGRIDRFAFELYLQACNLVTLADAAQRLAMPKETLSQVIIRLRDSGIPLYESRDDWETMDRRTLDEFHRFFRGMRGKTFSGVTEYCSLLHRHIAADLGLCVQATRCRTSEILHRAAPRRFPLLYGTERDCLTGEPVAVEYSRWLDLGKPLNLAPDLVSILTVVRFQSRFESVDRCFFGQPLTEQDAEAARILRTANAH